MFLKPLLLSLISFVMFFSVEAQQKDVPQFPEWMVENRIKVLNQNTPIQLDYNENVQAYIDVYTVKRREHLAKIISRSKLYFPLFEEHLDKYNLPLELKYLAVIESALDPTAQSSSGAKGLWQFLYHSGTMFDLEVTSYTDERCDPVLSTDAACRYLEYLYRNLNDWQLALAAYNGGIGVVKKAIARSGGIRDYWKLRPYLPEQVKGYVPAFIAATYAIQYAKNYDIKEISPEYKFGDIDTVYIHKNITFSEIVNKTGIQTDKLKKLNPMYTKELIPAGETPSCLFLPKEVIPKFIAKAPVKPTPINTTSIQKKKVYHTVTKGEYFHKIAIKHGCTIEEIMQWNKLKSKSIYPGQVLTIWVKAGKEHFSIFNEV